MRHTSSSTVKMRIDPRNTAVEFARGNDLDFSIIESLLTLSTSIIKITSFTSVSPMRHSEVGRKVEVFLWSLYFLPRVFSGVCSKSCRVMSGLLVVRSRKTRIFSYMAIWFLTISSRGFYAIEIFSVYYITQNVWIYFRHSSNKMQSSRLKFCAYN